MVYYKKISEAKQSHGADLSIHRKAKELRKKMTRAEKILWSYISNKKILNMHFRRQHPYGMFIIDFYCNSANLAIEIDGEIHKGKKEYDKERTEYLKSSGLDELRFKNIEIEERIEMVIDKIKNYIQKQIS